MCRSHSFEVLVDLERSRSIALENDCSAKSVCIPIEPKYCVSALQLSWPKPLMTHAPAPDMFRKLITAVLDHEPWKLAAHSWYDESSSLRVI